MTHRDDALMAIDWAPYLSEPGQAGRAVLSAAFNRWLANTAMAMDRGTARRFDQDGHLHLDAQPISKAMVSGYYGREIPDYRRLGLEPNRMYRLLRHPDELAKAAATFTGKPLLIVHKPVVATDHARALTIGAVGGPVTWDGDKLRAPLVVWDQDGIDGIEDNTRRQLSAGYRYTPDMTPGTWNGQAYDGVMRDIMGNHVALVPEGRAGPDIVVGDAIPAPLDLFTIHKEPTPMATSAAKQPSPTALLASGVLRAFIYPRLKAGMALDIAPVLVNVTGKTWKNDKPRILKAVKPLLAGKMAQDAEPDMDELGGMLNTIDMPAEQEAAATPTAPTGGQAIGDKVAALLEGKVSPEDLAAVLALLGDNPAGVAGDEPPAGGVLPNPPKQPLPMTKQAMDAALVAHGATVEQATIARLNAITVAREAVRPVVGTVAMDAATSAADVYRFALGQMGVAMDGIADENLKPMFDSLKVAQDKLRAQAPGGRPAGGHAPHMAVDAAAAKSFEDRFGTLPRRM